MVNPKSKTIKKSSKKVVKKSKPSLENIIIDSSKKILDETKDILLETGNIAVATGKTIIETGKNVVDFIKRIRGEEIYANDINKKREPVNIICLKYGTAYSAEYVNKLFNMVMTNITIPFRFYCFTDNVDGIDPRVIIKPIPELRGSDGKSITGFTRWNKEAGLCNDDLGGYDLRGKRVLFLDLDVIITDTIDSFFSYHKSDEEFIIIKDWSKGKKNVKYGQASCYAFKVGTLGDIKKYYEENADTVHKKYKLDAQYFLSDMITKKFGYLKFWPDEWVQSFKYHCLPINVLRWIKTPKLPHDAKIICFQGYPNPEDAIIGRWAPKGQKVPFLKRWYKHVRPTKWIADYWK
ncbi:MAG: hypothetical protein LBU68_03070 [Rickettsiales bacterium]|jgi:hypothetical protein|nr:hypothetical protein [Rickettsiales bacterium]